VNNAGLLHAAVNLPFLDNTNISDLLQTVTGLPTVTANDANAAAVGELRFGAGREFGSFLLFTLGTGVGSGLVLNRTLWTGSDGIASEFGHATVEPEGLICPCGNRGCLEQYASANALRDETRRQLDAGAASSLSGIAREQLTAADVGEAANGGDPLAQQLLARSGRYLGQAAATAANLLNLEGFILTGGMAASYRFIAPAMEQELKARAFPAATERIRIVQGLLGDDAGLLGMAALAWERA
jgi:glucokinase